MDRSGDEHSEELLAAGPQSTLFDVAANLDGQIEIEQSEMATDLTCSMRTIGTYLAILEQHDLIKTMRHDIGRTNLTEVIT